MLWRRVSVVAILIVCYLVSTTQAQTLPRIALDEATITQYPKGLPKSSALCVGPGNNVLFAGLHSGRVFSVSTSDQVSSPQVVFPGSVNTTIVALHCPLGLNPFWAKQLVWGENDVNGGGALTRIVECGLNDGGSSYNCIPVAEHGVTVENNYGWFVHDAHYLLWSTDEGVRGKNLTVSDDGDSFNVNDGPNGTLLWANAEFLPGGLSGNFQELNTGLYGDILGFENTISTGCRIFSLPLETGGGAPRLVWEGAYPDGYRCNRMTVTDGRVFIVDDDAGLGTGLAGPVIWELEYNATHADAHQARAFPNDTDCRALSAKWSLASPPPTGQVGRGITSGESDSTRAWGLEEDTLTGSFSLVRYDFGLSERTVRLQSGFGGLPSPLCRPAYDPANNRWFFSQNSIIYSLEPGFEAPRLFKDLSLASFSLVGLGIDHSRSRLWVSGFRGKIGYWTIGDASTGLITAVDEGDWPRTVSVHEFLVDGVSNSFFLVVDTDLVVIDQTTGLNATLKAGGFGNKSKLFLDTYRRRLFYSPSAGQLFSMDISGINATHKAPGQELVHASSGTIPTEWVFTLSDDFVLSVSGVENRVFVVGPGPDYSVGSSSATPITIENSVSIQSGLQWYKWPVWDPETHSLVAIFAGGGEARFPINEKASVPFPPPSCPGRHFGDYCLPCGSCDGDLVCDEGIEGTGLCVSAQVPDDSSDAGDEADSGSSPFGATEIGIAAAVLVGVAGAVVVVRRGKGSDEPHSASKLSGGVSSGTKSSSSSGTLVSKNGEPMSHVVSVCTALNMEQYVEKLAAANVNDVTLPLMTQEGLIACGVLPGDAALLIMKLMDSVPDEAGFAAEDDMTSIPSLASGSSGAGGRQPPVPRGPGYTSVPMSTFRGNDMSSTGTAQTVQSTNSVNAPAFSVPPSDMSSVSTTRAQGKPRSTSRSRAKPPSDLSSEYTVRR